MIKYMAMELIFIVMATYNIKGNLLMIGGLERELHFILMA